MYDIASGSLHLHATFSCSFPPRCNRLPESGAFRLYITLSRDDSITGPILKRARLLVCIVGQKIDNPRKVNPQFVFHKPHHFVVGAVRHQDANQLKQCNGDNEVLDAHNTNQNASMNTARMLWATGLLPLSDSVSTDFPFCWYFIFGYKRDS